MNTPAINAPFETCFELVNNDKPSDDLVTVAVSLYNVADYLPECLNSVYEQSHKHLDLIVVDDASRDNKPLEVAREWMVKSGDRFQRATLLRLTRNQGLAQARNTAFSQSRGNMIFVLDSDNLIYPRALSRLYEVMCAGKFSAAYTQLEIFGERSGIGLADVFKKDFFKYGNYVDAMAMVAKHAWSQVGGYTDTDGWDDFDLWCKFIEHGLTAAFVPEILCRYRVRANGMLLTASTDLRSRMLVEMIQRHPWLESAEQEDQPQKHYSTYKNHAASLKGSGDVKSNDLGWSSLLGFYIFLQKHWPLFMKYLWKENYYLPFLDFPLNTFGEVYQYYLLESQRIIDFECARRINVLKTDLHNEANARPYVGGILGHLKRINEAYSVEIQEEVKEKALGILNHKKRSVILLKSGDVRSLTSENETFELILDLSTLDHIHPAETGRVLSEYERVLKPGGKLLLMVWVNSENYDVGVDDENQGPEHQFFFGQESLTQEIRKYFSIEKQDVIFIWPYSDQGKFHLLRVICGKAGKNGFRFPKIFDGPQRGHSCAHSAY